MGTSKIGLCSFEYFFLRDLANLTGCLTRSLAFLCRALVTISTNMR
jgi:hypothetical protein